jgi:prevent-host-death family protein
MNEKLIGSAEFKATCLKIIDQINRDGKPVVITKRGNPVARLEPVKNRRNNGLIIGAMKGSVLRYDEPFAPAADASDWNVSR